VSEPNESQTSYSVEQADIFQYQSYSHSDDMFVILKLRNNSCRPYLWPLKIVEINEVKIK
jgi:hypothetical protein